MNNEPVAWMNSKGDIILPAHQANKDYNIPLYTHPVKEQYKFGVDWSKDGKSVTVVKICADGVAEVVFMDYQEVTHPVKELTDEEITLVWDKFSALQSPKDIKDFARAILKKGTREMKEEALKLADELDALHQYVPNEAPKMIRNLVNKLYKPLTDDEIRQEIKLLHSSISMEDDDFIKFARAILKKASDK